MLPLDSVGGFLGLLLLPLSFKLLGSHLLKFHLLFKLFELLLLFLLALLFELLGLELLLLEALFNELHLLLLLFGQQLLLLKQFLLLLGYGFELLLLLRSIHLGVAHLLLLLQLELF